MSYTDILLAKKLSGGGGGGGGNDNVLTTITSTLGTVRELPIPYGTDYYATGNYHIVAEVDFSALQMGVTKLTATLDNLDWSYGGFVTSPSLDVSFYIKIYFSSYTPSAQGNMRISATHIYAYYNGTANDLTSYASSFPVTYKVYWHEMPTTPDYPTA